MFLHWQTQRLYTLTLPQKRQKNLLQDLFHLLKLTLTTKEEINGMAKYLQQKPKWWPPSQWCRTRRSASPRSACQRTWRSLRCKLPKPTELENLAIGVKINIFSVLQMVASRLKTALHMYTVWTCLKHNILHSTAVILKSTTALWLGTQWSSVKSLIWAVSKQPEE